MKGRFRNTQFKLREKGCTTEIKLRILWDSNEPNVAENKEQQGFGPSYVCKYYLLQSRIGFGVSSGQCREYNVNY